MSFATYHVQQAIRAAIADSNGWKVEAEHLRAQGKLRLVVMSPVERWELAELLAHPPSRPAETVFQELNIVLEERKNTAGEWLPQLTKNPADFIPRN